MPSTRFEVTGRAAPRFVQVVRSSEYSILISASSAPIMRVTEMAVEPGAGRAMAGTELFTHIRHMVWTTAPSIVIAVAIFAVLGLVSGGASDAPQILDHGMIR